MNNKKALRILIYLFAIISLFFLFSLFSNEKRQSIEPDFVFLEKPNTNFNLAIEQRNFIFPKDFGKHEEFQTEWWYFTGNLFDENGSHFGYQLTFFRRGISANDLNNRDSNWATDQIYLAHFTLTDSQNINHFQKERIARGALKLAGVQSDNLFRVWLYGWEVVQISDKEFTLTASTDDFSINLNLVDQKKPIFHGKNGLSIKGDEQGNASYYFSQTRLSTVGEIRLAGEVHSVKGLSWMDHEFGSNTLGANQIGWDWFSLQLNNDQELMLFQLRQNDNTISDNSSGTFVNSDSKTNHLDFSQFDITVLDEWETSDGYIYPSKWLIKIADLDLELIVEPMINQLENDFFFRYWEGAVKFSGFIGDRKISGYGYVELTGYVQSMQGVF